MLYCTRCGLKYLTNAKICAVHVKENWNMKVAITTFSHLLIVLACVNTQSGDIVKLCYIGRQEYCESRRGLHSYYHSKPTRLPGMV